MFAAPDSEVAVPTTVKPRLPRVQSYGLAYAPTRASYQSDCHRIIHVSSLLTKIIHFAYTMLLRTRRKLLQLRLSGSHSHRQRSKQCPVRFA